MHIVSTNFAKTLVWKYEYDVKLWRHKRTNYKWLTYGTEWIPHENFCVRHCIDSNLKRISKMSTLPPSGKISADAHASNISFRTIWSILTAWVAASNSKRGIETVFMGPKRAFAIRKLQCTSPVCPQLARTKRLHNHSVTVKRRLIAIKQQKAHKKYCHGFLKCRQCL